MSNQVQINPQSLITTLRAQRDAAQDESALKGARILDLEGAVRALQKQVQELTPKEDANAKTDPRVEGSV